MKAKMMLLVCGSTLLSSAVLADASYQETTQITGGSFVDVVRQTPFLPASMKKMFDPVNSLTMLHGNQLASVSKSSTQIVDLDQEAVTHIDNEKKTYYVMTFAEMRQAMKDMPKKLEEAQAKLKEAQAQSTAPQGPNPAANIKVTFDVNVTEPGAPKTVNGILARQQFLTIKAHVTTLDTTTDQGANTITYNYVTEIWSAPEPPEMLEVDAFSLRYAKKMMEGVDAAALMKAMKPALSPGATGQLFATNPALSAAMSDMAKKMAEEQAKIKGVRILEITRLGGDTMLTTASTTTTPPPPASASGSVVGNAVGTATVDAGSTAATSAADKLGAVGGAFGRSLLGALKHGTAPAPAATPTASAAPSNVVMYETTTQKSDFSQETIPPAAFVVPSGFKKVDSPMAAQLQK